MCVVCVCVTLLNFEQDEPVSKLKGKLCIAMGSGYKVLYTHIASNTTLATHAHTNIHTHNLRQR